MLRSGCETLSSQPAAAIQEGQTSRKAEQAPTPVSVAHVGVICAGAAPVLLQRQNCSSLWQEPLLHPKTSHPWHSTTGSCFESAPFQSPAVSSPTSQVLESYIDLAISTVEDTKACVFSCGLKRERYRLTGCSG